VQGKYTTTNYLFAKGIFRTTNRLDFPVVELELPLGPICRVIYGYLEESRYSISTGQRITVRYFLKKFNLKSGAERYVDVRYKCCSLDLEGGKYHC
jgi:hypothetical protein